jgi:LmbE family N-acetylglucosaminyl deacetylase
MLAPHIDDETIGAGGVLMKHVRAGDRVAILTFADCTPERIAEGHAAGAVLGAHRQEFLPFTSRGLLDGARPAEALARFLAQEQPDLVYAPSLYDRHTDHVAVNLLLARRLQTNGLSLMIYGYEVWSTLTPNVAVDITAQKDSKARALACFVSQNRANDWPDAALSLNRYRGISTGAGAYAEAFLRLTAKRHADLVRQFWG